MVFSMQIVKENKELKPVPLESMVHVTNKHNLLPHLFYSLKFRLVYVSLWYKTGTPQTLVLSFS